MIRRLYVDNYRCLQDFTWEPGTESLLLGVNGAGKTAILDALELIRVWCLNKHETEKFFDSESLTRWSDSSKIVKFGLDLETDPGLFSYKVEFDCGGPAGEALIHFESLHLNDSPVFLRDKMAVSFRRVPEARNEGFSLVNSQSAFLTLRVSFELTAVDTFLSALDRMIVVGPVPHLMSNEPRSQEQRPTRNFENAIAWYWAKSIGNAKFQGEVLRLLSESWPEFVTLRLEPLGKAMILSLVFKQSQSKSVPQSYEFQELSDGEKMLVALYSLAAFQRIHESTTIILDEPDNFLALAELQPWLMEMIDGRPDGGQVIIASHNPEIINTMGPKRISYLTREDHSSPTVVRKLVRDKEDEGGLSLSELVTLGWLKTEPATKPEIPVE